MTLRAPPRRQLDSHEFPFPTCRLSRSAITSQIHLVPPWARRGEGAYNTVHAGMEKHSLQQAYRASLNYLILSQFISTMPIKKEEDQLCYKLII